MVDTPSQPQPKPKPKASQLALGYGTMLVIVAILVGIIVAFVRGGNNNSETTGPPMSPLATQPAQAAPAAANPSGNYGNDTGAALATDQAFVGALHAVGIDYANTTTAVIQGRAICVVLQQGTTFLDTVTQVEQQSDFTATGDRTTAAATIVGAAIAAYCPQYESEIPGN